MTTITKTIFSNSTPFYMDIIDVWCPSLLKKLILRTLKRDTSVENPVCSHPIVYLWNKRFSTNSSNPAFYTSEIPH